MFYLHLLVLIGHFHTSDITQFSNCINLLKMKSFKSIYLVQYSYKILHILEFFYILTYSYQIYLPYAGLAKKI